MNNKLEIEKSLKELICFLDIINIIGKTDIPIKGLAYDSRQVKPGFIFFAFDGVHTDGHVYIEKAISNGAVAIIHSQNLNQINKDIIYIHVNETRPALAKIASAFYSNPSEKMNVIGVTGTDGKSTTVWFIYQLLEELGKKSGFISTVNIAYSNYKINKNPYRQSTPEAREIQSFLYDLNENDVDCAVIEATSHGLSDKTGRLKNVDFNVAVLTNVTHEHLEFHGSIEQYRHDKANLFRYLGKNKNNSEKLDFNCQSPDYFGVVNMDDPNYLLFSEATDYPVYSYSMNNPEADLYAYDIIKTGDKETPGELRNTGFKTKFKLKYNDEIIESEINIPGLFNIATLMAASLVICKLYKLSLSGIIPLYSKIKGVRGRMEIINEGQSFKAIVDYAHTPKSFEKVFPLVRELTSGKLISVFGSGGERDIKKRPVQGRIASEYSDIVILTDEDPRLEDSMKILEDIAAGCNKLKRNSELFLIPDRVEAIKKAFSIADSKDTVLFLGKGHELSIIYPDGPIPWDEIEVVKNQLSGYIK